MKLRLPDWLKTKKRKELDAVDHITRKAMADTKVAFSMELDELRAVLAAQPEKERKKDAAS